VEHATIIDPGFSKIVHLEPYFNTGEATVQPVMMWANGKPCYEGISKHASVGAEFFKTIQPVPGHSFVYVIALGSWETYGENRNGDAFPERAFMASADPPWISEKDVLPLHYKTFEQFGHNYRHHVNKDPKKAVGRVVKAFWNALMHRVELLIDLEDAKAPDLAKRIEAREFPPVSMGTRVKYDVCSICGNRAPTRAHYCDHLKFNMKQVINDRKVCALNPSPRFFDISWVYRPADATAFMMKKVAEDRPYELLTGAAAGEYLADIERQKTAANKLAVINKVIQGVPIDAKSSGIPTGELVDLHKCRDMAMLAGKQSPVLPDSVLQSLSKFSLPEIFSSTCASGMMQLSTPETTKIIMFKSFPKDRIPESVIDKSVVAQQSVMDFLADFPQVINQLKGTGSLKLGQEFVCDDILATMLPYAEKRAGVGQYLKRRFVPESHRNEIPYSTPLTITDPTSGSVYGTTRGAAIRSHDEIAKRNLYKILGGAALLGGAYKLVGHGLDKKHMSNLKPLAALGLGYLGYTHMPKMGPHYMSDQGVPVPTLTELTKVSAVSPGSAVGIPLLGTLGLMAALSHDYQSRLRSGIPVGYEGLPLGRRVLDNVEQFAYQHPIVTSGVGTVAGYRAMGSKPAKWLGGKAKELWGPAKETAQKAWEPARETLKGLASGVKISAYLGDVISDSGSTVKLPEIDLDKVAEWLGWVIYEG